VSAEPRSAMSIPGRTGSAGAVASDVMEQTASWEKRERKTYGRERKCLWGGRSAACTTAEQTRSVILAPRGGCVTCGAWQSRLVDVAVIHSAAREESELVPYRKSRAGGVLMVPGLEV
jgi:hypothetical protein